MATSWERGISLDEKRPSPYLPLCRLVATGELKRFPLAEREAAIAWAAAAD
jgi:hypothetical protein